MPRSRRDGTPARSANKRRLSDAFIKTVRPDPDRVVVYWDTLLRGLALSVQPSGHLAWKCVYTMRGRGPRWYSIGNAGAITLSDARKLASKILYQVAEGADPHADRLALRGRGSFEQVAKRYLEEHARKRNKSWRQADALVARYLLPRWAKLDIGNIKRTDVKAVIAAIAAPVLANQVLAAASAIFSWAMRQEIIAANPCSGVEKNDTTSRERVLSDAEIAAFWPHLSAALKWSCSPARGRARLAICAAHMWSMIGGGSCRGLLIRGRAGWARRMPRATGCACPSLLVRCCRTCSRRPCAEARCNRTCSPSAPSLAYWRR